MTAPEPTQPLTDEGLEELREYATSDNLDLTPQTQQRAWELLLIAYNEVDRLRAEAIQHAADRDAYVSKTIERYDTLAEEAARLRAENTALRASLDQFRSFPTDPGPGDWSTTYRMGYADAGRDVRAILRALGLNQDGSSNADPS